jgi:ribonuclease BN (tRNA processing enzyme)
VTFTILPLGINGYMPSYGRETMSILVLNPPHAILLDAGTGVARFLEEKVGELLSQCTDLHILLSHYHLDHIIGLFYMPGIWSKFPVHLYAPASPFIDVSPRMLLQKLLEPPFSSDFEPPPVDNFFLIKGIQGNSVSIGGCDVSIKFQKHPGGSLAFRFADEFVYATDTGPDSEMAVFAKGTKYLFHDVYLGDQGITSDPADIEAHSSLDSAIKLAKAANVERLVPIHLNPHWRPEKVKELQYATSQVGASVIWPNEGQLLI